MELLTPCPMMGKSVGGEQSQPFLFSELTIIIRLTLQSNLLLRTFDNKVLHAPVQLKNNDWVLETATGTGRSISLSEWENELGDNPS